MPLQLCVSAMKITILCVGKVKEKFYRDALAEYAKRLGRYTTFTVTEVTDEKTKEQPSDAEKNAVLKTEGDRLLKCMDETAVKVALAIDGNEMDSVGFAGWIEKQTFSGNSQIQFIIGGSLGLHEDVLKKCDISLSFSKMTFPHQLMRVILAEQIYRAFRIIRNEPYHK